MLALLFEGKVVIYCSYYFTFFWMALFTLQKVFQNSLIYSEYL